MDKRFTEGIAFDGAAILDNGKPITITEILDGLNKLDELQQLKLCEVVVTFKDKKTPTFEEWYDDIYTQMYVKESAFKKYFEMSEEELLLRYKKKFKIKP